MAMRKEGNWEELKMATSCYMTDPTPLMMEISISLYYIKKVDRHYCRIPVDSYLITCTLGQRTLTLKLAAPKLCPKYFATVVQ